MNLLLDTHVLLWWLDDHPALSQPARAAISAAGNAVYVSAASLWEIVIKKGLKKLVIPEDFREVLSRQHFEYLDIRADHAFAVGELPPHHRDPFDRMLIAQCIVEGMTFVTHDDGIKQYGIPVLGA